MSDPDYFRKRKILIDYLKLEVEQEDWHGVCDAANDLRELDAEQRGRNAEANRRPHR